MLSTWHAAGALARRESQTHEFGEGDLRTMARMRYTGVSYEDIGWIFGIAAADARQLVRLYVRMRLRCAETISHPDGRGENDGTIGAGDTAAPSCR
jgi:hypothetical protein